MNPPHLRIQLLDCDAEEQQRDRSHIPNTNKLFDRIDRNLNNLYLATFAPGALAATLTALTRTDGRLIRPSSTRILQLNDTGQWTTVERDSLTGIGANVLCAISTKRLSTVSSGSKKRSQTELRNTLPP